MKRVLTLMLLCITTTFALAQSTDGYVHYTPIPVEPSQPVQPLPTPQYPVLPPPSYYQNQNQPTKPNINVSSEYLIQTAKINGQDFSQHYINAKALIAFYTIGNDPTSWMAVVIPGENSNSHGEISTVSSEEIPQTPTAYGMSKLVYKWSFINTNDRTTGTATVTFLKEYRKEGTAFICNISSSTGVTIEFMGLKAEQN
jgi:hypothetical protein